MGELPYQCQVWSSQKKVLLGSAYLLSRGFRLEL